VLHLPFDYDDGSYARDRSGHGNHCTIYGATLATGKIGMARSFDGVDDYAKTARGVYENGGTFTFEAWIYFKSFPQTWNAIFGQRNYPRLQYNGDGKFLIRSHYVDGVDTSFVSSTFEALGVWKHIAVISYPEDDVDFYVDGEFLNRDTNVGTISHTDPATNPITLATPTIPGVNWANVIIDEVRIYNKALTVAEIARHMYLRGI